MSKDASGSEFDDVMSSVRSLVTAESERRAAQSQGKLLLTPSFRVADSGETQPHPPAASERRAFPTLEERIAELEEAVGAEGAEWEPDGSEDLSQHAPDRVVLPLDPKLRRNGGAAPEPSTLQEDLIFVAAGEPETEADESPSAPAEAVRSVQEHAAIRSESALGESAEKAVRHVSSAAAPTPPKAPAPAGGSDQTFSEPVATFRHQSARKSPPPAREHVDEAEEEPAILDEAALRDLVAEILREELQGALGERITRNVRKLVRAEIQRAFAARDLD